MTNVFTFCVILFVERQLIIKHINCKLMSLINLWIGMSEAGNIVSSFKIHLVLKVLFLITSLKRNRAVLQSIFMNLKIKMRVFFFKSKIKSCSCGNTDFNADKDSQLALVLRLV